MYKIKEEWINTFTAESNFGREEQFDLFKNPSPSERAELPNGARGIVTIEGDLYISTGGIVHKSLLPELAKMGIIDKALSGGKTRSYNNSEFLPVQMEKGEVYLSDTFQIYNQGIMDDPVLDDFEHEFKKKNPSIRFHKVDVNKFLNIK